MLIALRRGFSLFFAGQTTTQRPHPVQSSAATWIVNCFSPKVFGARGARTGRSDGASESREGSKIFPRMVAWGQCIEHFMHWMQTAGSQTGTS